MFSWTTVALARGGSAAKEQGLTPKRYCGFIRTELFVKPTHSGLLLNYRLPRCCENSYPKESNKRACRRAVVTGIFGVMTLRECSGVQHWLTFLMEITHIQDHVDKELTEAIHITMETPSSSTNLGW